MDRGLTDQAEALGRIKSNLISLETILRVFLLNDELGYVRGQPASAAFPQMAHLDTLRVGDRVRENAFTNYDTLAELIQKYNNRVRVHAPELCIDETLVKVRDALAHGRMLSSDPQGPHQLLKFGRAEQGQVPVEYSQSVTKAWSEQQMNHVAQAVKTVNDANERLTAGQLR